MILTKAHLFIIITFFTIVFKCQLFLNKPFTSFTYNSFAIFES